MTAQSPTARVSMLIDGTAAEIYRAFVDPAVLTLFWLTSASAPLEVGRTVHWEFMVHGASVDTTATRLDDDKHIAWQWSGGMSVEVEIERVAGGSAVTIAVTGFDGSPTEQMAAALDTTEGFAIVLCDLKTLIETGKPGGHCRAKARLIEMRG